MLENGVLEITTDEQLVKRDFRVAHLRFSKTTS